MATRLAAAGEAGMIAIYDTKHGEHIDNLTGHAAGITSLDWNETIRLTAWFCSSLTLTAVHADLAQQLDEVAPSARLGVFGQSKVTEHLPEGACLKHVPWQLRHDRGGAGSISRRR